MGRRATAAPNMARTAAAAAASEPNGEVEGVPVVAAGVTGNDMAGTIWISAGGTAAAGVTGRSSVAEGVAATTASAAEAAGAAGVVATGAGAAGAAAAGAAGAAGASICGAAEVVAGAGAAGV